MSLTDFERERLEHLNNVRIANAGKKRAANAKGKKVYKTKPVQLKVDAYCINDNHKKLTQSEYFYGMLCRACTTYQEINGKLPDVSKKESGKSFEDLQGKLF